MESLKRRSVSPSSESEDSTPKRSRRNNGTETFVYLKSRAEQDYDLRQQELELKKAELELQKKKQEQVLSQQLIMQLCIELKL